MHSFPIPPVVVNTSDVSEPCPTSNTLLEYNRFLSFLMDAIDLLWLLGPVRLGIRVANPHIKICRALGIPEATRPNVQSCVLRSIGPSSELFFISDVLENCLDLDIATYRTQNIGLEVSQLVMTLDYKAPLLANHYVVYCEVFSTRTY